MSQKGRRRIAIGLAITAPLMVAVAILAHAHPAYIYARPVDHPYVIVGSAALMVAVAARLACARRALRITTYVVAALVALPAFALVITQDVVFGDMFAGPTGRGTVATSPDFKVVAYQGHVLFRSDILVLRVQTRAGLLSREGGEVACFMAPGTAVPPSWLFGQARFTAPDQVQVSAADGTTWWLTFDTGSLNVTRELDRCSTAPDPAAD